MKYLLLTFLSLGLLACNPKELPTVFVQKDGYALLKVSHQTTREELDNIQIQLEEQGITLDYSGSSFFDNGSLQILKMQVVTPKGHSGQTTADIVNLQYRYYGFLYQMDGQPGFKIGEIPEN